MKTSKIAVAALIAVAVSGCATKRYGRMQPVSSYEMQAYDCKDIAVELSKVDAFDEQIREGSGFNGASALGILGDFGIGNSMEKGSAEKSSINRRRELNMLAAQKDCGFAMTTKPVETASTSAVKETDTTPTAE